MSIHNSGTTTPKLPAAPPCSLALTYPRASLIAIARSSPSDNLYPPSPADLSLLPELLRHGSVSLWGADESTSTILDEADDTSHIARTLQAPDGPLVIDNFRIVFDEHNDSKSSNLLFDYQSLDKKPPILINFADPFKSTPTPETEKASTAFQSFTPLTKVQMGDRAIRIGDSFSSLRMNDSRSSTSSSFSDSPFMRKVSRNPWAPPFPLPTDNAAETPSLLLPKVLPSSLPARPGPLLPHFVKKEFAILSQPMSLPTVKPLGPDWLQPDNISGNERRRRSSAALTTPPPSMRIGQSLSVARDTPPAYEVMYGSQSLGENRPERLVKLGQSLRQSIAAKGQSQKA